MEKYNHVSYPVPSVRKYDFVASNLAPAQRNPRDIASYCRGCSTDPSGLGLTADATTIQSKPPEFGGFVASVFWDPGFDQIDNVSPAPPDPGGDGVATRQAPAPEPAQLRNDLLGFSCLPCHFEFPIAAACNGGSSTYGAWPSSFAGTSWTGQTTIKMPMMAIQFVSVP
jgi:hypothetical protein